MNIPESIFHKIVLFNSHPVADMFKQVFKDELNALNKLENEDGISFYDLWEFGFSNETKKEYIRYMNETTVLSEDEFDNEDIELYQQLRIIWDLSFT